jgi:hypothetical protein
MNTLQEGMQRIVEAIGRKKGRFAFGPVSAQQQSQFGTSAPFALAVGSHQALRVGSPPGFVCMVGMTLEHVRELRDACNEALGES